MAGPSKLIGRVLDGKYQLDKLLGQGGMGAVFLATHLGTKRPVALKLIAPQFMANEEFVERFRREAEAAGRLRHPNVVNVTDFGFDRVGPDQLAYLVMEYLDGCSLGDMLKKRGSLQLNFVVDVVEQICLAIGNAHQQGIIHRDLKPDNIWLQPNQRGGYIVKVLDFGLAKLRDRDSESAEGSAGASLSSSMTQPILQKRTGAVGAVAATRHNYQENTSLEAPTQIQAQEIEEEEKTAIFEQQTPDIEVLEADTMIQTGAPEAASGSDSLSRRPASSALDLGSHTSAALTRVGAVMGTPLYMSPEQCRGEALDPRSDIYSLGVIVYQMLAGLPPFVGETTELITMHCDVSPPQLSEKRNDIPKSVVSLVMSALAKRPSDRPPAAVAFADALRATSEGEAQILRQAKYYYYSNAATFFGLSFIIILPFVAASYLLALLVSPLEKPGATFISVGFWFILFLLVLLANKMNTALSTLIVKHLRVTPTADSVKKGPVLKAYWQRFPALLSTALLSHLRVLIGTLKLLIPGARTFIDHQLYPPAVMMEGLQGAQALDRSKTLVSRLRPMAVAIAIRDFAIAAGSVLLMPFFTAVGFLLFNSPTEYFFDTVRAMKYFNIGYCWFFVAVGQTVYNALPISVLYFRARQAGSETLDEPSQEQYQQDEKRKRQSVFSKATIIWLIGPLVMIALLIAFPLIKGQETLLGAVRRGNANKVNRMLEGGADPNSKRMGTSALMYASKDGYRDIVKALLNRGADPHAKDGDGDTAMMYAALDGRDEIVKVLVSLGVDVNVINNKGNTPLTAAAKRGRTETVRVLLDAGADPGIKDETGKSALAYAEEEGHSETAEVLRAAAARAQ